MKFSIKTVLIRYMCLFPLIHIVLYSVLQGKYTNVLYAFSEIVIIAAGIRLYGISKKDAIIMCVLALYIPVGFTIHQFPGEIPIVLNYIYFAGMAVVLNNTKFKEYVAGFIEKNELQTSITSILYILVVVATIINGTGLLSGWGTSTLKGPYGTPHTLAYEMLILICLNLCIMLKKIKLLNLIITLSLIAMVLLTASRVAIIGMLIILFFFVTRFDIKKRLLVLIAVACIGAYMLLSTEVLNPLLEKTELAISNGSVSNGRLRIFRSSISSFLNYSGFEKWIIGIGYNRLLEGNYSALNYRIQAHNDVLNAFIAFGPIFCALFIYSIYRMVRGTKGTIFKIILLLALINLNGLVSYMTFSIPMIVTISFIEKEKVGVKITRHRKKRRIVLGRKNSRKANFTLKGDSNE